MLTFTSKPNKTYLALIVLAIMASLTMLFLPHAALADSRGGAATTVATDPASCESTSHSAAELKDCQSCSHTATQDALTNCIKNNSVVKEIQTLLDFLSALVGIVVVGSIIFGGIQYMAAGDNPSGIQAAKKRITNSIIALVIFIFIAAFLQWLVPGGVFQ